MLRRLLIVIMVLMVVVAPAQNRRSAQQQKAQSAKTTTRKSQTKKKSRTTRQTTRKSQKNSGTRTSSGSIKGLQSQRAKIQQQIKEQQQRLSANRRKVKQRMDNLIFINHEIEDKQKILDTIRHDITRLDSSITILDKHLAALGNELEDRKQRYKKSVRYMHRNRSLESQLMFIFSAQNLTQMYRRLRFTREYAAFQKAQGEAVLSMKQQIEEAQNELNDAKKDKNKLLWRGEQEQRTLETKQTEQQKMVNSLQREQKTIEGIIATQQKKDANLNAQIDRLIAEEAARAKARAEAEARRKAAEAAAKKRAEELARKKAAAEAAARENARRIAEAKAREEKAKAEARAAARKSREEQEAAERAAREAERERKEAESKARDEAKAREREMAKAEKTSAEESYMVSSEDRRISGSFESNRGRLPMPITGPYQIARRFGTNSIMKNVTLSNKGIDIRGQRGAQARSIFDGEVSAIFSSGGMMTVMVRHGKYISVYSNLASVSVHQGQKVSTRQIIGNVSNDNILQFQLRNINNVSASLNPERWLGR